MGVTTQNLRGGRLLGQSSWLHARARVCVVMSLGYLSYECYEAMRLLYVWLQLVHGSLNIATTTKITPPLDRPVNMMTHEALTAAWDWIFAEIRHRPVSARYRRFGRVFGHGSTLKSKVRFEIWKLLLLVASSNISNLKRDRMRL